MSWRELELYLGQTLTRGEIVDGITKIADAYVLERDPARRDIGIAFYELADQFMPVGHRVERKRGED